MENTLFSINHLLYGCVEEAKDFQKEGGSSGGKSKDKKMRTSFSKDQIATLEERFCLQKYLTSSERTSLAEQLNMSDAQVKTWFQNRRTKWRRHESEMREQQRKAVARILESQLSHNQISCQQR
ncbi:unnamed protein product [Cylicocyclus nassatus]|uniref:Homeobox domain-containing protein n=1 Tax=Cylicocyclus nassatus TaxID=53992 RepID=A0AA36MH06_CYLNA|nr:unnamed protein product [Cylicocyclus nassatus]